MKRIKAIQLELPIDHPKKQIIKVCDKILTIRIRGLEKFKIKNILINRIVKKIFIQVLV